MVVQMIHKIKKLSINKLKKDKSKKLLKSFKEVMPLLINLWLEKIIKKKFTSKVNTSMY